MSELITVTRKSDGEQIIVDVETAQQMHDDGLTVIPTADDQALTETDVYGEDID